MARIMVVDDEKNMRELLRDVLEMEGFGVDAFEDGESALTAIDEQAPDLMVLDLRLPGIQGMELLKKLRESGHTFAVVIITAHGDINTAVEALKNGAVDFIVKPFDNARLVSTIKAAVETGDIFAEAGLSGAVLKEGADGTGMVGKSEQMKNVIEVIERVADTDATVLIQGETGTGKGLVARTIHMKSNRRDCPLVSLNCAALPETLLESELFGYERGAFTGAHCKKAGRMELAHGGTLFLDEVGDLTLSAQAKLLRAIEEKEVMPLGGSAPIKVDIRVIAATNRDIEALVREGLFREDLYYRLKVVPLYIPPLSQRREDIPPLARRFAAKFAARHRKDPAELSNEELDSLMSWHWPGNIRELAHVMETRAIFGTLASVGDPHARKRAYHFGGKKQEAAAPESSDRNDKQMAGPDSDVGPDGPPRPLKDEVDTAERAAITKALKWTNGHQGEAAKLLGISYKSFYSKVRKHGIKVTMGQQQE